jgi:hypothetical protein
MDQHAGALLPRRSRQVAGAAPVAFLKARLNAASKSYPTSEATSETLAAPSVKRCAAVRMRRQSTMVFVQVGADWKIVHETSR